MKYEEDYHKMPEENRTDDSSYIEKVKYREGRKVKFNGKTYEIQSVSPDIKTLYLDLIRKGEAICVPAIQCEVIN